MEIMKAILFVVQFSAVAVNIYFARQCRKELQKSRAVTIAALEEAEMTLNSVHIIFDAKIPTRGPTPEIMTQHESVRLAWDEFCLVYKLAVPQDTK